MFINVFFFSALFTVIILTAGDEEASVIAAWTKRISKISLNGNHEESVVPTTHHSVALDVNSHTNEIFWSDGTLHKIFKASLNNVNTTKSVAVDNIGVVDGLAVDWIYNNLYWTDTGRNTIEVMNLATNMKTVIVKEDLMEPRAIVLYPHIKKMFWSDWGTNPKIESAYLDGSAREAIVTENLGWPNGLTIDFDDSRLYWIDGKKTAIESSDFKGRDRKLVYGYANQGFGISVFGPYLYFSDWTSRSIRRIIKNDGSDNIVLESANFIGNKPMALQVLHPDRQPLLSAPDRCLMENQCSQLCINNKISYKCFCKLGYKLDSDGHTCIDNGFLLTAWRDSIVQVDVGEYPSVLELHKEAISIVGLDFLYKKGVIFWSNINLNTISQGPMKNMLNSEVIVDDVGVVDGLAVDWICNNLYWSDTLRNTIEVRSLDTGARKVLYSDDLDEPRAIVIYPPEAKMFFTDWGKVPKIESAALDGSERHTLITKNLKWPNGLAIDWNSKRLYWVDGSLPTISSCNFDGTDNRLIANTGTTHQAFGITLNENSIYYSEWKTDSIYKINRQNVNTIVKVASGTVDPMGIKIYNSTAQPDFENRCHGHSCSHICLPTMHNSFICACPKNHTLSSDEKTCVKEEKEIINLIDDIEIKSFKISNIGNTTVNMEWKGTNRRLFYVLKFECLRTVHCQTKCEESEELVRYFFSANVTVDELTPGTTYSVKMYYLGKLLHSDTFTTKDSNNKTPEFLKDIKVLNSTSAVVSWQAVEDCASVFYYYELYKVNEDLSLPPVEGRILNSTTVTLHNLVPGSDYRVNVFSLINGLKSEDSLILKFTTNAGTDEQDILGVTVYKHMRNEIGLRWKMEKDSLVKIQTLRLSYMVNNAAPKYVDMVLSPCNAWPDMYCYTLKNLTAKKNYSISITPVFSSKIGLPINITATTKEAAPGIPSHLTMTSMSLTSVTLKWGIPEFLNGNLRSFLINIEEVDKYLEDYCCQDFPVMEVHVTEESPYYETGIAGLQPASSYAVSVSAKTIYFGPPQILTVHTKPPSMKVFCQPNITNTAVNWIPQNNSELWSDVEEFKPLIGGYMLLAVCIDLNYNDTGIADKNLNAEVIELLGPNVFLAAQYFENGEAIDLSSKRDIESKWGEAGTSSFKKGYKYRLAAVQVAQYIDAYRLDMILTSEFVY